MTPKPNIQGDPQRYPSPPKRTRMDEDTTDELDPADLARLYQDLEILGMDMDAGERSEDLDLGESSFDTSTVLGMMLIIIIAMTIYWLTHLFMATFKGIRF